MVQGKLDREDLFVWPLYMWSTAAALGLIQPDLLPIPGVDWNQVLVEFGHIDFTLATTAAVVALGYVYAQRDTSLTNLAGADLYIVYATIGLILAPPIFPAFEATVVEKPAAYLAFTVQNAGLLLVSRMN